MGKSVKYDPYEENQVGRKKKENALRQQRKAKRSSREDVE